MSKQRYPLGVLAKKFNLFQARGEAKAVLGSSSSVRSEHLEKLSYITAVINESLRMYPPISVFMREALQDDVIGGYKIQKGSYIIIPTCVVHHMEENWPNHNDFRPERFLDAGICHFMFYDYLWESNVVRKLCF